MIGEFKSWRLCPIEPTMPARNKEAEQSSLVARLLANGRKMNPLAYHLDAVEWSVFGTVTWDNDAISSYYYADAEQLRQRDFLWLVNMTCHKLKLRNRDFAFYYKTEWGANRRGHGNFLIAKQGTGDVSSAELSKVMQDLWTQGNYPKGRAKIEPFKGGTHLAGVCYQSKNEFDKQGNPLLHPEIVSRGLKRIIYSKSL